jgi:hypothetical protein
MRLLIPHEGGIANKFVGILAELLGVWAPILGRLEARLAFGPRSFTL